MSTHHIAGGTANFFVDVQRCYERFDPHTPDGLRLPTSTDIPTGADEFDMSRHFAAAEVRRYEWERTYRTREYIDLLLTYSGHRAMPTNQYVYADGPTVVIAYVAFGSPPATDEDALTEILDNLG